MNANCCLGQCATTKQEVRPITSGGERQMSEASLGFGPSTYTVKQVAQELGIGINQAYEGCHSGDIPTIRIGHRILIPAWFIRQLREGNSAAAP